MGKSITLLVVTSMHVLTLAKKLSKVGTFIPTYVGTSVFHMATTGTTW